MRIGLIGMGGIGSVRATAMQRSAAVELVAAADLDPARLAPLPATVRRYRDPDRLLSDPTLEAVVIATPPPSHVELALAALDYGKHVLIEKPMAPDVDGCLALCERAEARGLAAACGFNHRYFPAVRRVRDDLMSGRLGEISHVRGYAGHVGLKEFSAPWMHDADVIGGGTLSDNGIHMIDLVAHLLGDVAWVAGAVSDRVWQLPGSEDNGLAVLRSAAGTPASLHSSWSEWKGYRFSLEVYGQHGTARAYYAPMLYSSITMSEPGGARRRRVDLYPSNIVREKLAGWQSTVVTTFLAELQDFVDYCRGRCQGLTIATARDGLRAVAIATAIRACSRDGQAVDLTRCIQSRRSEDDPGPDA